MNAVLPAAMTQSPPKKIRVLLVDDHPIFRKGIAGLISEEPEFAVCGEVSNAPSALEAMRQNDPDVVVLDISLQGTNGIELIKLMHAEKPHLPILMLTMHDESLFALRALRAGARGYLMKIDPATEMIAALRKVLRGELYVTPRFRERLVFKTIESIERGVGSPVDKLSERELEVLHHLGRGFGTREIADALGLSVKTIETHRAHIKEKLGFHESGEMVRFAIEWMAHERSSLELGRA
jgi:DNA-binding NarL/FixJ family response regulator